MFNNILVVCVGNICRSPSGEYLLKTLLPEKKVSSAGIAAVIGKPADKMACKVSESHGISLDGHLGRQLTPELCQENDLILVMEQGHINAVTDIAPEARGKTMLFSYWLEKQDIPDPYRQSIEAFEHVYKLINASAIEWAKKIN